VRIVEVVRQFHPKVGGIESCVLNITRGLRDRGHDVRVVTLDRDVHTGAPLRGDVDSIPVHRVSYFGPSRYPIAPGWLRFTRNADVVHVHAIDFFLDSAAVARATGALSAPFIVSTHGGIFHTPEWRAVKQLYWNSILKASLREAAAVVAVSPFDVELFRGITSPEKLIEIDNGTEDAFRRASSARVDGRIVCVGRVTRAKGIERVVRLVARVAPEFPHVELLVIGPDENGVGDELIALANELGISGKVRVLGTLGVSEMAELVSSAQLYVSASLHEGFAITSVEAMSAGVPVLVTHTGIHDQIVREDVNGWFWSGDPDEESAATLRAALATSPDRLEEVSRQARLASAPFEWEASVKKYEAVLNAVAAGTSVADAVGQQNREVLA